MCVLNSDEAMNSESAQNTVDGGRNNRNNVGNMNPYDQITALAAGEHKLLDILRRIREVKLGDSKPSEMYREIQQLAGDYLTESAIFELWVDRMPESFEDLRFPVAEGDISIKCLVTSADVLPGLMTEMPAANANRTTNNRGRNQNRNNGMQSHFRTAKEMPNVQPARSNWRPSRQPWLNSNARGFNRRTNTLRPKDATNSNASSNTIPRNGHDRQRWNSNGVNNVKATFRATNTNARVPTVAENGDERSASSKMPFLRALQNYYYRDREQFWVTVFGGFILIGMLIRSILEEIKKTK